MFSREQIDQVRSAVDIVETIREYVPSLKASGRSVKGLCPFHSERTPSFHVQPEKGIFKCFGCGESGDVIAFVSKLEQLSFSDSLRFLADRSGVRLEQQKIQENREPEGNREKLFRVLESASKIYEDQLWDDRLGGPARSYLEERGVTEETRQVFHLGYAASTGGSVFEALVKKGFAIELCQQAGLVSRSNAGRFYDPMFGRLIFPIFDGFGHVIGFGGRVIPQSKKAFLGGDEEESGPKYLNSPETPVFSKGKSLYGILQAKPNILASRRVIIMEGYMDVIGVFQGGVNNAVATLGTAFTRDHAKALKRYADEITAFFDPDEAGERAAVRSLEPMIQEDFFPRVVMTTETLDPDELIREKGKEFFDGLIYAAPDFLDYLLRSLGVSREMPLQKKSDVAMQVLALIAQSPNEILKAEWLSRLAAGLGLKAESLEEQMKKRKSGAQFPVKTTEPAVAAKKRMFPSAEEELLQLVLAQPTMGRDLDLTPSDFTEERHKKVLVRMQEQLGRLERISVPALADDMDESDRDWLIRLSMEEREFTDPLEHRDQLVRSIKLKKEKLRLQELGRQMAAGQAGAAEQQEYKDLLRRLKGSINESKGMVTK